MFVSTPCFDFRVPWKDGWTKDGGVPPPPGSPPSRLPATDGQSVSPSSRFLTLNWSSWSVRSETMGESSLGDPGPDVEATRDRSGRMLRKTVRGEKKSEGEQTQQCVYDLLSASSQCFVREPDGVYSHHSEFWRLPAATSCYLLSPIKWHFSPSSSCHPLLLHSSLSSSPFS